jgi:hypothetical protein
MCGKTINFYCCKFDIFQGIFPASRIKLDANESVYGYEDVFKISFFSKIGSQRNHYGFLGKPLGPSKIERGNYQQKVSRRPAGIGSDSRKVFKRAKIYYDFFIKSGLPLVEPQQTQNFTNLEVWLQI